MIQAPITKPTETKAPVRADVSGKANKASNASKDLEGSQEGSVEAQEFANELEASLTGVAKVIPVEVSGELILDLPSEKIDSATPKVFDPALTQGVEKLIQPQTTEAPVPLTDAQVLELANAKVETEAVEAVEKVSGEIAQAMLKTPKVTSGRAPAIEFAQSEIDPQLMNMEDFVAQKNLATKKALPNAYGMKAPSQQQNIALENGLKQTQVVSDVPTVDSTPVNSQQFILNMMNEQKGGTQVNEVQTAPKVFDMSQVKSGNSSEIINQITDYVAQAKVAKEPTVSMRMNHDQLGMIDITVSKVSGNSAADAVAINIGAHTLDAKNFFNQNSKELFSHMASAGINVSDLKVETPSQTAKNDFDFGSQQGRNSQGDKQFGSEQNQRRHEQERRQDLWKLLNQEAA
jgi:hypothetical protein